MRIYAATLSAVMLSALATSSNAFISSPSFVRQTALKANPASEFDHLLGEGDGYTQNAVITSRRVVKTNGNAKAVVQLMSSEGAVPLDNFPQPIVKGTGGKGAEAQQQQQSEAYDPYSDSSDMDPVMQKIQAQQSNRGVGSFVADLNLQELMFVLIIPSIATFAGVRWGLRKASGILEENANEILDSYAKEMIYHDGDFDEMKLCHKDYKRRLLWLGPKKKEIMLKHFLEAYAKKKIVSPQSISSLSYVFQIYNLSEEKAADILVSLCKRMGTDKISSAGKLLFFGSRILKSPEGKKALRPVKEMIMATYRDKSQAEQFVDAAQSAMGEAAYKNAVTSAGKKQTSLTPGWKVLGLDKETAERIYEAEAEDGFVSEREAMYKGQATKYDKKGRAIDDDGKLVNPEEGGQDDDDDDEDGDAPTGNVFECGECGYTLFIAKGRDFKFYGEDFECPECGAKKDKFVSRDIDMDD